MFGKILKWLGIQNKPVEKERDHSIDRKIDHIFDTVDALCWESNWEEIDRLLVEAEQEQSTCLRISWLTITACVKSKLKNREAYFNHTAEMLRNDLERERLLDGLE